ncbi:MAG: DUF3179 domain-containing protein [Chloroflexota bacterium]|nr:DUF3179 domain-containing protein [Chloroflexota bacterium]
MWKYLIVLLSLLLITGCASALALPEPTPAAEPSLSIRTLFPPDAIQALDHPATVSAEQAAAYMVPRAEVMGVVVNDEARAYPVGLLSRHELVNDTLGGEPIAVTFCALCNSGIAFSREVKDTAGVPRELSFGVSGQVVDNAMVMMDRQTGTLWAQSRLKAIEGELAGTALELLTARQLPWEEWVAAYPESTFVIAEERTQRSPSFAFPSFPNTTRKEGMKERNLGYVLGASSDSAARAYPLKAVEAAGVVNAELDNAPPFLLVALGEPGAVAAWQRVQEGRTLTFNLEDGVLRDRETGTRWDAATGTARSGPLEGTHLEPFPVQLTHWRGWKDLYPSSDVWQPNLGGEIDD